MLDLAGPPIGFLAHINMPHCIVITVMQRLKMRLYRHVSGNENDRAKMHGL